MFFHVLSGISSLDHMSRDACHFISDKNTRKTFLGGGEYPQSLRGKVTWFSLARNFRALCETSESLFGNLTWRFLEQRSLLIFWEINFRYVGSEIIAPGSRITVMCIQSKSANLERPNGSHSLVFLAIPISRIAPRRVSKVPFTAPNFLSLWALYSSYRSSMFLGRARYFFRWISCNFLETSLIWRDVRRASRWRRWS